MIKRFPFFSKLSVKHKDFIEKFVSKFPPYSDYNFTSLWSYDTDESVELSLINDNLAVKFKDYVSEELFYSFLGVKKVKKTIDALLNHSLKKNIFPALKLIPQTVIDSGDRLSSDFKIYEDYSNHDYIVSTVDIASLPISKFRRKKYLIDKFKRKYPDYQVRLLDINLKKNQKLILDLFLLWKMRSGLSIEETQNELNAIKRLLTWSKNLNVHTLGIFYRNQLIAFNIYEATHMRYGISAFQKADKTFTGIYSVLSHEAAKHLYSIKCEYINYEQDLGIEGLRLSKSLWKPVHYLKKYIVTPKK